MTESSRVTWRTCAQRSVGSCTLASIATVKIFTDYEIRKYYKWITTVRAIFFGLKLVCPLGDMFLVAGLNRALFLTDWNSFWFTWSTIRTFAFLATAVLDERNLCFFAFLSWGTGIEVTVYFLGKQFAAFDDLFHFVDALQARCLKEGRKQLS